MGVMASQITSLTIVYTTVYSGTGEKIKVPRHWPCAGNSPVTTEFPAQMAGYAENVSISWRHQRPSADQRLQIWQYKNSISSVSDTRAEYHVMMVILRL